MNALVSSTAKVASAGAGWLELLRFLVGLVIVFALIWFLAQYIKKRSLGDYDGPGLRVMARLPLTRSSQVVLVEIAGRMFLLGAGEASVTTIAEIYDTDELGIYLGDGTPGIGVEGIGNGSDVAKALGKRPRVRGFDTVLGGFMRSKDLGEIPVEEHTVATPSSSAAKTPTALHTTNLQPVVAAGEFADTALGRVTEQTPATLSQDDMAQVAAQLSAGKAGGVDKGE